jgi:hypothetical protein
MNATIPAFPISTAKNAGFLYMLAKHTTEQTQLMCDVRRFPT